LIFFVLLKIKTNTVLELAKAIVDAKTKYTDCSDRERHQSRIEDGYHC